MTVAATGTLGAVPGDEPTDLRCRGCGAPLTHTFVDLGMSPLANSYVEPAGLRDPETFYPLHAYVCAECLLVQLPAAASAERIFGDYAYFSSYSTSWLDHARRYVDLVSDRFDIGDGSHVVEVASNDGYLLQYFRKRGVDVLGIEPAANVAAVAQEAGIPTLVRFFGEAAARDLRSEGRQADLLIGNNVLAHVPDLNDFVSGLALLLAPDGVLTMEFPHLLRLIEERQFDTIYHEHFSYFSLRAAEQVLTRHGLRVFDVEELETHGGSLRVYVCHDDARHMDEPAVADLLAGERAAGLEEISTYTTFGAGVLETKLDLVELVLGARRRGETIVGYGAAAKGNTLLNYCGIGADMIDYVVDRSPHKQGRFLPGTRIPICPPERVFETQPDYLLLLAWNLKAEIMEQMADVRSFGCRFVVPVPAATVVP